MWKFAVTSFLLCGFSAMSMMVAKWKCTSIPFPFTELCMSQSTEGSDATHSLRPPPNEEPSRVLWEIGLQWQVSWNSSVASPTGPAHLHNGRMMESSVGREGAGTEANRSIFVSPRPSRSVGDKGSCRMMQYISHTCATVGVISCEMMQCTCNVCWGYWCIAQVEAIYLWTGVDNAHIWDIAQWQVVEL